MKESRQLKVTDLRIGDMVRVKEWECELIVTGIRWDLQENDLTNAVLYLDFKGNEFDEFDFHLSEVELVEKGGEE